jgi:hypothetical protein
MIPKCDWESIKGICMHPNRFLIIFRFPFFEKKCGPYKLAACHFLGEYEEAS